MTSSPAARFAGFVVAPIFRGLRSVRLKNAVTFRRYCSRIGDASLCVHSSVDGPRARRAGELLLRMKVKTIVVAAPPSVIEQCRGELEERFGLVFEILDRAYLTRMCRERGFGVNPWRTHSRFLELNAERVKEETLSGTAATKKPSRKPATKRTPQAPETEDLFS